jgi:hypothetical protein
VTGNVVRFTQPVTGAPSPQGKLLNPSVAVCPAGTNDIYAYGGGAYITPNNTNGADIVTVQSSFPGTFSGGSVTPGVTGSSANAWEADAVITSLAGGDTVNVQAYAICGP